MLIQIIFIVFLLGFIFWVCSHLYSSIFYVPYVNSSKKAIHDALKLAKLKKGQTFIDLGCGRGDAILIASKEFGAKAFGYEISPLPFLLAKIKILLSGQSKKCHIHFGDFRISEDKLADADVVYLYLLGSVLKKIEKWLFKNIGSNTKTVCLAFSFIEHKPFKIIKTRNLGRVAKISLYIK